MLVMASVVLASAGTSAEWVPADSARLNFKFGNDLSWEATKLSKQQTLARKAVLNQTANALAHVWNYRGIVDAGAFDSTSEHAAPWVAATIRKAPAKCSTAQLDAFGATCIAC